MLRRWVGVEEVGRWVGEWVGGWVGVKETGGCRGVGEMGEWVSVGKISG